MVVQDNLDSGIKEPLKTFYLTTTSQFGLVAKTRRTNQKGYSAAGVVLRGPVYERLDNPIPKLEGHLEGFGGNRRN